MTTACSSGATLARKAIVGRGAGLTVGCAAAGCAASSCGRTRRAQATWASSTGGSAADSATVVVGASGRVAVAASPRRLKTGGAQLLDQLTETCSDAAQAYVLAQSFTQMVRERNEGALDGWFAAVEESGLADLRSFAAGLRRDEAAVRAGLSLIWSQGQVEGQVN